MSEASKGSSGNEQHNKLWIKTKTKRPKGGEGEKQVDIEERSFQAENLLTQSPWNEVTKGDGCGSESPVMGSGAADQFASCRSQHEVFDPYSECYREPLDSFKHREIRSAIHLI